MNDLERIVEENAGLIWEISHQFYNIAPSDLYQAGALGVIKAYYNYQKNGETKFSTYAYKYIKGEMYNAAMNKTIKQSKDLLKILKLIEKGKAYLAQELMHEPSKQELANYLEIEIEQIDLALMSANNLISLDDDLSDNRNLYEVIGEEKTISVDDQILLKESMDQLGTLEQDIIKSRYFEDLTQSETASKLGITQVMVSRYEAKSLAKMREFMYM